MGLLVGSGCRLRAFTSSIARVNPSACPSSGIMLPWMCVATIGLRVGGSLFRSL